MEKKTVDVIVDENRIEEEKKRKKTKEKRLIALILYLGSAYYTFCLMSGCDLWHDSLLLNIFFVAFGGPVLLVFFIVVLIGMGCGSDYWLGYIDGSNSH